MNKRKIFCLAVTAICISTSCGHSGNTESAPPPPPPPIDVPPQPSFSLQTGVGINGFEYQIPTLTPCLASSTGVQLPALGTDFKVDGDLSEWAKLAPLAVPPGSPAPTGFAVAKVWAAKAGEDVAVAADYHPAADASFNIEFGGVVVTGGNVHTAVRRLFRVYNNQLQQFQDGSWQSVAAAGGSISVGAAGSELLLRRSVLGDVVTWPTWWMRVFTRNETASQDLAVGTVASTGAAYFPSLLEPDSPQFVVAHCDFWATRKVAVGFTEIRDGTVPGSDPALEKSFQYVRAGFDAAVTALGAAPLPLSSLAVIAAKGNVGASGATTNTADGALGVADDVGVGSAYYGGAVTPFRALAIDLRQIEPSVTEVLPEAKVLQAAAASVFDLYLQSQFPAAPLPLENVVRQALIDQLTVRNIGWTYWLDHYRAGILPLLAAKPPTTAAAIDSDTQRYAFGHLLAIEFDTPQLLGAWRRAAALTGGGTATSAALLQALIEARAPSSAAQDRVSRLWHGWMDAQPFDPAYAPTAFADKDHDGLPDFVEAKLGTDPSKSDSDGDGYSDYAELVAGTNPLATSSTPGLLVPDGDFSDWQQLLPKKTFVSTNRSGACPKAADINFYAAIADHDHLMIGAVATEFWDSEPNSRWEASLDFTKDNQQFLITAVGNSYQYELRHGDNLSIVKLYLRPFEVARRTVEFVVDRSVLGLPTYFDAPEAMKIRLRTIYQDGGKDVFCDQTDWFSPYIAAY